MSKENQKLSERELIWFAQQHPKFNDLEALRDGPAFIELLSLLLSWGYQYGATWFNHGNQNKADDHARRTLGPGHLVVLSTRPALDDQEEDEDDKKGNGSRFSLVRTGTVMDEAVLAVSRRFFSHCERPQITLAPAVAERLPEDMKDRADVEFRQYRKYNLRWPYYQKLGGKDVPEELDSASAGYVIYYPEMWPGGPAILNAFGVGANTAVLFCHLLRTRYADVLKRTLEANKPHFFMLELATTDSTVKKDPFTLHTINRVAERWQTRVIVDTQVDV